MPGSIETSCAREAQRLAPIVVAIVGGGLVAGTVDIGAACLINARSPRIILQAIASGVLGAASFRDGLSSAFAGLGLQWAMAIVIAAIYVLIANRWAGLRRRSIRGGIVYGVVIYLVMNYVVVPLSAAPFHPPAQPGKVFANGLAMILFGLIVAAATQLSGLGVRPRRIAPGA